MKILENIIRWLFILCLPLVFISASLAIGFNSAWLYKYGFDKYSVSRTTGLDATELSKAAGGLVQYWNSGDEYIKIMVIKDGKPFELFNEREIIHLKDVKGLVWLDYRILLITLIYILACVLGYSLRAKGRYRYRLTGPVLGGCGLTLLLILMLGIASAFDFDRLFTQFHLLSFANDLWLLDPATDYLIMLFPEGFWFDAALFCMLVAGGFGVITGGVTGCVHFYTNMRRLMGEADKKGDSI